MAPAKILQLFALTTLAVLSSSFGVESANALAHSGSSFGTRNVIHRGHPSVAKRKRSFNQRRCRERPPSSTPAQPPTTSTTSQQASQTQDDNNGNGNSNGNSGGNSGGSSGGNSGGSSGGNSGGSSGGASSGLKGKVCLAWPNGNDPALANFKTDHAGAVYTWGPELPSNTFGYSGVPMLWGSNQVQDFQRLVKQGYATHVLGFNEPDHPDQSNLSPQDAAGLWKQYIQPLASQGYKLVSPATTSNPASKQWMRDFFSHCDGCTFDAIAVHYYDTSPDGLISYLEDYHKEFGKPLWLTEVACQNFNGGGQCSMSEIQAFMGKFVAFAESTDWIEQYCWFGAMHDMVNVNVLNQLMQPDGQPNDLGHQYLAG